MLAGAIIRHSLHTKLSFIIFTHHDLVLPVLSMIFQPIKKVQKLFVFRLPFQGQRKLYCGSICIVSTFLRAVLFCSGFPGILHQICVLCVLCDSVVHFISTSLRRCSNNSVYPDFSVIFYGFLQCSICSL